MYLAVVLDAHSPRVVGWNLDRTLAGPLTLAALEMALELRGPQPGLVHHSDRRATKSRSLRVSIHAPYAGGDRGRSPGRS